MCVEAPFFENQDKNPTEVGIAGVGGRRLSTTKLTLETDGGHEKMESSSSDLYSELHLSILQTLQNVPSVRARMTQKQVGL